MEHHPLILSAKDVNIQFDLRGKILHAIRGIDLDLYQGEVLAIVGESGSGKSVFTKSFMGLLDANGSITGGTIDYYGMADGKPLRLSDLRTEKDWLRVRGREIAMARFIRNQILIIRDRDYNVASRCIGTPTSRIVLRNLLPYLVSVIMLRMALTIPAAIGSEVFITYIGLGLSVETPSLGNLINDGRKVMMQAGLRYQLLYPTIILSFVTIAFYLIGNAFSDAADPKNHMQ